MDAVSLTPQQKYWNESKADFHTHCHSMKTFQIHQQTDCEENPFDRQERISWWSQEKLAKARVMVVGAGAIGNETLKNLALLGIGHIFIVDFDTISTSNLSRTVLFRKTDVGQRKAEVAALRARELALNEDVKIDWLHGDIVWELGVGVFRRMDIVLGCLDNVETRFAVNRRCWETNTPWIDAGINELAASVSVYVPPDSACYQCGSSKEQQAAGRRRYSCDDFKRAHYAEGKVPTVQISSAIVSAIQVQEAIKLICGQPVAVGKKIYFQGKCNYFDVLEYARQESCSAHATFPDVISIPLSFRSTLSEFLEFVSRHDLSGPGASLDFRGDQLSFVVSAGCRGCGNLLEFYRPSFRIYDTEIYCPSCRSEVNTSQQASGDPIAKTTLAKFDLESTDARILNMTLHELGVPALHILGVENQNHEFLYYELSADTELRLPNICARNLYPTEFSSQQSIQSP
jgi:molybdopterin/thiamine biosynthesis adenylyltransferase